MKRKRIVSALLALAMVVGAGTFQQMDLKAAVRQQMYGPSDGVDLSAGPSGLMNNANNVYMGTFKHATVLKSGSWGQATQREADFTPILWRIMGEEEEEGYITVMSKYGLDSMQYLASSEDNVYKTSEIRAFLNNEFLGVFSGAEKTDYVIPPVTVGVGKYNAGTEERDNRLQNGVEYPYSIENQKIYLPWATNYSASGRQYATVFWSAGDDIQDRYALVRRGMYPTIPENIATLKSGTAVEYWTRTPHYVYYNGVLVVLPNGRVQQEASGKGDYFCIRPEFKLNPDSIIFASEVGGTGLGATEADGYYYATSATGKNFKLTILNENLSITNISANGKSVAQGSMVSATQGKEIVLGGAIGEGTDSIAYKIVSGNEERTIISYGVGTADSVTIPADLESGDYTVYAWAQKSNSHNSNEGSVPFYFTLSVAPYVPGSVPVTGIKIEQSAFTNLAVGNKIQLTAVVSPEGASNKTVTWVSSNPAIASVDNEGVVSGLKAGTIIITAISSDGNIKASIAVKVTK